METEETDVDIEQWASGKQSYSRDFLRRFSSGGCHEVKPEASRGDSDDVELSLGLSLGGRFGVDPPKENKLFRSTSIASMSMFSKEREFPAPAPLVRTCSLPAESEEEHRKRKEMQSLKRLEAKRKRLEKRNSRAAAAAAGVVIREQPQEPEMKVEKLEGELDGCRGFGGSGQFGTPAMSPEWAAADVAVKSYAPMSQGSIGSSSSCVEFEGRAAQGFDSCSDSKSTAVNVSQKAASAAALIPSAAEPAKKRAGEPDGVDEIERSMMEVMPCVSTRGDGPNGRKIEGFLYKYRKGEEVRIVCVCHGSFLTPAEFVRHAGGGDVAHPLRHIVVTPPQAAFSS